METFIAIATIIIGIPNRMIMLKETKTSKILFKKITHFKKILITLSNVYLLFLLDISLDCLSSLHSEVPIQLSFLRNRIFLLRRNAYPRNHRHTRFRLHLTFESHRLTGFHRLRRFHAYLNV